MVRKHTVAIIVSVAALALLSAGCSEDSKPVPSSSAAAPTSVATPHSQEAVPTRPSEPTSGNSGNVGPTTTVPSGPTHTVTRTVPATPQAPNSGGTIDVPCTGPDQGTVCTNPNHGGGDNPSENGTGPTTSPKVRDDDPGGKPCTTGMGVAGTYVYSDDTSSWVCQIG